MTDKVKYGIGVFYNQLDKKCPEFDFKEKYFDDILDALVLDKKEIPLLWWRAVRKISALINLSKSENSKKCCLNVYSFMQKNVSLKELLIREIDIAECILQSKCKKITAFKGGNACNVIVVMENDSVANLELATTMPNEAKAQCQHRLITTNGMACDRVIDNVIVEEKVSLFAEDKCYPLTFDDGESWLYGLTDDEISKIYCVYMLLVNNYDKDEFISQYTHLNAVYNAFVLSSDKGETVLVKGE